MTLHISRSGLTRRQLLSRSIAAGAAFVVGPGFVAGSDAAWATETVALKPETMATLVQMARDIYPHDRVPDRFYVVAVKGYDTHRRRAHGDRGRHRRSRRRRAGQGLRRLPRHRLGSATASRCCAASKTAPSSRRSAAGS